MAKKELVIVNDEDGGRTLKVDSGRKSRSEDLVNPLDPETGESTFDDINSRFTMDRPAPRAAGADRDDVDADGNVIISEDEVEELFPKKLKPRDADLDEDEDDEDEEEDEDEDRPVDSAAEDEEEDDEPSPRRKGVRGRIDRERRLRQESDQDVEDLRARVNELQAKIDGQASEAEYTAKQKDLDTQIETVRAELKAAVEAGETDKQLDLQEKLSDLKADKRASTSQYEAAKTARAERKTTVSPIVARKVDQWKRQHPRYNKDAEFAGAANGIDIALSNEGYDPESREYYVELDKRLAKRFPEEYKGRKPEREQRRHPSQNLRGEGGNRKPTKQGNFEIGKDGRVKLSKFDVQTMRMFNLDPDNAADVREYVNNNR